MKQNFGTPLSRSEMKNVVGGLTTDMCSSMVTGHGSCWHNANWTSFNCDLNQSQAQAQQQQYGGSWCTSSCTTSCSNAGGAVQPA